MIFWTGSGKSYTMMGSLVDEETKGIIPRLCDTLFEMIAEVSPDWLWMCMRKRLVWLYLVY